MKQYLIDTNILDAFPDDERCVVDKMKSLDKIKISCISIGELYYGVMKSKQKTKNLNRLNHLLSYYEILYIGLKTAFHYGEIKAKLKSIGKPIPENDIWIAAIAKEHDMIVATRDKHLLNLDFIQTESW